jgi:hypothetical protein
VNDRRLQIEDQQPHTAVSEQQLPNRFLKEVDKRFFVDGQIQLSLRF